MEERFDHRGIHHDCCTHYRVHCLGTIYGREGYDAHDSLQETSHCVRPLSSDPIIYVMSIVLTCFVHSAAVIVAVFTQGPFIFLVQYLAEGYQALYQYAFLYLLVDHTMEICADDNPGFVIMIVLLPRNLAFSFFLLLSPMSLF